MPDPTAAQYRRQGLQHGHHHLALSLPVHRLQVGWHHPGQGSLQSSSVGFRGAALTGFVQCTAELTQGLVGCLPHVQVRALQQFEHFFKDSLHVGKEGNAGIHRDLPQGSTGVFLLIKKAFPTLYPEISESSSSSSSSSMSSSSSSPLLSSSKEGMSGFRHTEAQCPQWNAETAA